MADRSAAARLAFRAIVIVYLLLGALYAVATPPWQIPDEPAHYNYVRHVATYGALPELRPGDYPAAYLEEIKARRFPPDLPIDPIRYESHQPPLYYILAAAVYRAASTLDLPHLVVLRAFSVFLGALTLLVAYRLGEALYPGDPVMALGAVGLAAALPMHLTMTAAVNNDVLSGLLLVTIAWRLVAMTAEDWTPRRALGLGALLGLALLTKMQSYVAFALAGAALLWDLGYTQRWRPAGGWRRVAGIAAILFGTALLMALPWLLRNAGLYGPLDPLGLARHHQVVAGPDVVGPQQLTTRALIADHGWPALITAFLRTTFRSFWGLYGWMAVPMHPRVYQALALLTLLAAYGLALQAHRTLPRHHLLLALWVAATAAGYLWWNVTFVQHQGRYLFPALVPIGLAATAGLREVYRRPPRHLFAALALGLVALLVVGLLRGDLPSFSIALLLATSAALYAAPRIEARYPGIPLALTYAALTALALLALPLYIIPHLSP